MSDKQGVLERIAEDLGEGWEAEPYISDGADGHLNGPNGAHYHCDARAFGEYGGPDRRVWFSMETRAMTGDTPNPRIERTREEWGVADFVEAIREHLPAWEAAHSVDVAKTEEVLAGPRAFAAEVAEHLSEQTGEAWTGGAVDDGNRDRLTVLAFLRRDRLEVRWRPVEYIYGTPWKGIPGEYRQVDRLHIRGYRDRWPGDSYPDEITVAATRPAKQVASEIRRRCLPAYIRMMEEADREERRHEEAVAGAAALAELAVAALDDLRTGRSYRNEPDSEVQVVTYSNDFGGVWVRGEATCTDETVRLEVAFSGLTAATFPGVAAAIVAAANGLPIETEGDSE